MKKFLSSKLSIALIILSIFIMGQLLGALAIKHYFIKSKIDEFQPQLTSIAEEVSERNTITNNNPFYIMAYNVHGERIKILNKNELLQNSVDETKVNKFLINYLPRIVSKKTTIAEIKEIHGFSSKALVIGLPIVKNNKVIGGIFLLKPARSYVAALDGFYLVFFTTLAIGTIIILIFLRLFIKERNQLEQMRKDYIANISHELKSPLASIKALTETLADHVVTEQSRINQYYSIILRESAHLEKLIYDLLELSRLQSEVVAFKKKIVNTNQLIEHVSEPFSILAEDMDLQFKITDQAKNLPVTYTNEDRIMQVLTILLDNAFKFTPENGRIEIDAECTNKKVKILVSDNGPGISKEFLPYIFERFKQADSSHNTVGSGLGLSIAHEIMVRLGEEIQIRKSRFNSGTTFTISIKRI
ncbi:sensor histidine kinase [Ureibacillus aquaedulcis]|uniref:histidine kinase n=1 Tax=Ureibacillus aquaedulcis TaxID=3058421 RepID=A0ABT8GVV2_9BACL|nr:HAMP domain-containing sensor histidine kinase [Ureibacillus sp. BA0131]MDN4495546.1 HAMP domain-containing sensor histidine kinase [Ureibacillus sp. BA0131]